MDDRLRQMLAGYVDNELTEQERIEFERELAVNAELQRELKEFNRLKTVTGQMKYADLPDQVWEAYWQSVYRKVERGAGWVLASVGAIVLLVFGVFEAFSKLYADPTAPLWLKTGLTLGAVGLIILLVSLIRERFFAYKRERYTEVEK
ncbi:MAG: hypothetical protein HY851_05830 [candidate division Zixibacteria bacterium]|nr:hypothetical protein [candidate division Zixibacteria bacterium]